jgi:hypothetical protein
VEAVIHLDTRVVAWRYAAADERMSPAAGSSLRDPDDIRGSPMVRLELQYLFEVGRVTAPATRVMDELRTALGRWSRPRVLSRLASAVAPA